MSYEQFWYEDPQLFWMYADAYNKNKEIEFKEKNYYYWLEGQYTLLAMSQVMTNAFSKSRHSIYPKKPFGEEQNNELTPREKFELIAAQINQNRNKKAKKEEK